MTSMLASTRAPEKRLGHARRWAIAPRRKYSPKPLRRPLEFTAVNSWLRVPLGHDEHAFQACSLNHSDISPLWNQRVASGQPTYLKNCVRPPNVPRSLTAISLRLSMVRVRFYTYSSCPESKD